MSERSLLNPRGLVPQVAIDLAVWATNPIHGFSGNYSTWLDAQSKCLGYEDVKIVERYKLLFNQLASRPSLGTCAVSQRKVRGLAAILLAQQSSGKLIREVLDFGGAYGSDFWQLSPFLDGLSKWEIVESPQVAGALGIETAKFKNLEGKLAFTSSISERMADLVYSSGTIQCLPDGLSLLDSFADVSEYVVLDRLPVFEIPSSRIMIQKTAKPLGGVGSSYPVWFFSKPDFEAALAGKWKILMMWDVPEDSPFVSGKRRNYSGYLLQRTRGD